MKAGRKLSLTKELIKEICGWIEKGNTFKDACILTNISEGTFHLWKKQGLEDEKNKKNTIFFELLKSVRVSLIKFKTFHIEKINEGAEKGNTQDAKWLLEKKFYDEYGKKEKIELHNNLEKFTEAFDKIGIKDLSDTIEIDDGMEDE